METAMSWTSRTEPAMLEVEKILSEEIFGRNDDPPIITFPYSEGDNCIAACRALREGRLTNEALVHRFLHTVFRFTPTKIRLKRIN